jgi:hypothetical protein
MKPSKRWIPVAAGAVSIVLALFGAFTPIPTSQSGTDIILYEIVVISVILGLSVLIYRKALSSP